MGSNVIIYSDGSWPLWLRVVIAMLAAGLFVALAWRYYNHDWCR